MRSCAVCGAYVKASDICVVTCPEKRNRTMTHNLCALDYRHDCEHPEQHRFGSDAITRDMKMHAIGLLK